MPRNIHNKKISATIPYITFNAMVGVFDLNNQDDMDALIQNLIEEALDEQLEINQTEEYHDDKGMQQMSDYAEKQSEAS